MRRAGQDGDEIRIFLKLTHHPLEGKVHGSIRTCMRRVLATLATGRRGSIVAVVLSLALGLNLVGLEAKGVR